MKKSDMATMDETSIDEKRRSSRWLKTAQVGWIVMAGLALVTLIISMPAFYAYFEPYVFFDAEQLYLVLIVLATVVSLGLAVLLFLQKRDDRMALFLAYFFVIYGIIMTGPLEAISEFMGSDQLLALGYILLGISFMILLYIFPTGSFFPSWSRWLVPAVIVIGSPLEFLNTILSGNFLNAMSSIGEVVIILIMITGVISQILRYRRLSSTSERLQVKWVLFGFVLFLSINAISSAPYGYLLSLPPDAPEPWWADLLGIFWSMGLIVIPISFSVSVLRYRLWDIDFIIRRTIIYGLLTALLLAIYFGSVVVLQRLFTTVSSQQSPVVIVISTLVIAVLFQPLRLRIQRWIDRRFFRAKYDASKTLHSFAEIARDEVDLEEISASLMQAVNETMRPKQSWLWLKHFERPLDES